ncbi:MAG: 30S ribosomal protein S6e [Candidatus Aenigmatarchaeota archaeon]
MANFKFVISDPETRKAHQLEIDQNKALNVIGKKIGEEFDASFLGLPGYFLKITGGTDKDGFPMHPKVKGPVRKRILLSGPPGFHPKIEGQKRRKSVRGDTINTDIIQINCKVVKKGEKSLEELIPSKKGGEKSSEEKK